MWRRLISEAIQLVHGLKTLSYVRPVGKDKAWVPVSGEG